MLPGLRSKEEFIVGQKGKALVGPMAKDCILAGGQPWVKRKECAFCNNMLCVHSIYASGGRYAVFLILVFVLELAVIRLCVLVIESPGKLYERS
jgi:hypothetical protein